MQFSKHFVIFMLYSSVGVKLILCLLYGKDNLKANIPATTAAEAPPAWGSAQEKYRSVKNKDMCTEYPVELHDIFILFLHGPPSTQQFVYLGNSKWK